MPKQTPNPTSTILANAIIGGAGLAMPQGITPPPGMAAVVLYFPMHLVTGSPIELQENIGLPWIAEEANGTYTGIWLKDEYAKARNG